VAFLPPYFIDSMALSRVDFGIKAPNPNVSLEKSDEADAAAPPEAAF
jgi:hypothetical protein